MLVEPAAYVKEIERFVPVAPRFVGSADAEEVVDIELVENKYPGMHCFAEVDSVAVAVSLVVEPPAVVATLVVEPPVVAMLDVAAPTLVVPELDAVTMLHNVVAQPVVALLAVAQESVDIDEDLGNDLD